MGKAGPTGAGRPGAPFSRAGSLSLREALPPQPSLGVLSPCNSGSSRKWLNPMYFYTPRLGRVTSSSLSMCVGGRGGARSMWGKGSNAEHVARSHALDLETAHANGGQKSPNATSAEVQSSENTTENNGPATLGSQAGEGGSPVGFLWALSGRGSTGNAGDTEVCSPPPVQSGLPSHICLRSNGPTSLTYNRACS